MQSWVNFGFTWFSYSGVCCSNRFRFGCFPCGKLVIHRLCATPCTKASSVYPTPAGCFWVVSWRHLRRQRGVHNSSFNGDEIQLSSTADAAENNTNLSSRGFRDDTLLVALDAPTPSNDTRLPSGLMPESPPSLGFSSSGQVNDQQRMIDALVLRVKEQAVVIGKLAASSGCASSDDVSQHHLYEHQAATQPFTEPTTSSGPGTDDTAAPLVIKPKSLDGLKASPAIWHSMMLEYLTPLHEVLEQRLLRPVMSTVGMVGICATWTLIP